MERIRRISRYSLRSVVALWALTTVTIVGTIWLVPGGLWSRLSSRQARRDEVGQK
ncbi:MAG: hypothetical protein AAB408_05360 [Patescibacteria group bacterium]